MSNKKDIKKILMTIKISKKLTLESNSFKFSYLFLGIIYLILNVLIWDNISTLNFVFNLTLSDLAFHKDRIHTFLGKNVKIVNNIDISL